MEHLPLLYRAARDGVFGKRTVWARGALSDALFVYLEGEPEPASVAVVTEAYRGRPLVCLSAAWEAFLKTQEPWHYTRYAMAPRSCFALGDAPTLPAGFQVKPFDEAIFAAHPFGHGENYADFAAFRAHGSGAAVLYEGEVAAAASSFLTYEGEVELDVSTCEAFRRRGLATACVRAMLADCEARGIVVHWDAQNPESRHLAEKFGYVLDAAYPVYILPPKE